MGKVYKRYDSLYYRSKKGNKRHWTATGKKRTNPNKYKNSKYWAIKNGLNGPRILEREKGDTFSDFLKEIGPKCAIYEGFNTREEAEAWMGSLKTYKCCKCDIPFKSAKKKNICKSCERRKKPLIDMEKVEKIIPEKYKKMKNMPRYIKAFFIDNDDKELINISEGTYPWITFKCLKCGNVYKEKFKNLKKGNCHICDYSLSKGEFLVKQYLEKNNIRFVTQYDTLKCVNHETNHVLPYDFQLKNYKIIIEVQGDQHLKFTEHFHGTEEAFKYQKYKDKLKKDHAINNGYTFVEIFYNEFSDNTYITKIEDAIKSSKTAA